MSSETSPPFDALVARADAMIAAGGRRILGIAGPPGGGKSTLAARLTAAVGREAAVVPMDGFHLSQAELVRLGRASRKGAPDTFDVAGYVALLRRLRAAPDELIYAPAFRREIEEPVAGAIAVGPDIRLVITEGNYLLCGGAFAPVRGLLDECWFVAPPEPQREAWLLARHKAFGRVREDALAWIAATDAPNARLIEATRAAADFVIVPPFV